MSNSMAMRMTMTMTMSKMTRMATNKMIRYNIPMATTTTRLFEVTSSSSSPSSSSVRMYSPTSKLCNNNNDNLNPQEKLLNILEEYRLANYQQEIPTRFVKEIVHAADKNKDGYLERHEIFQFFENIDAKDALTDQDLDVIRDELGFKAPFPVEDMKKYLLQIFAKKK